MVMVEKFSLMDKFMRDNGIMANFKEKEFSFDKMEHHIQDNGRITCKMVMGIKNGEMGPNMREIL